MRRVREWLFRIQPLFRRRAITRELAEELEIHLELAAEAKVAEGMSREQARIAAEQEFGRIDAIEQDYRDERGVSWVEHLIQDLTFGARMLRKSPVFTAVVVTTLALGIGMNSALFSALNTLLLRPLPVREPKELVGLFRKARTDQTYNRISFPDYATIRDRSRSFAGVAAYNFTPVHFSAAGFTSRIWGQLVTPNYFEVLGLSRSTGPGFSAVREGTLEPKAEVVLSHSFWKSRFNADAAIMGQTIILNGESFAVVGIAPETFRDLEAWLVPDVWVPISMQPTIIPGDNRLQAEGFHWLRVVARLHAGVTIEQARAELSALAAQINTRRTPDAAHAGFALVPDVGLHPELRPIVRRYLLLLLAAAGVVLLIICVNLATLWLARSMTRWKEMGTRLALGATRPRLFRQMITESVMLAAIGAALALALTPLLLHAIGRLQAASAVPAPVSFAIDFRVLAFSGVIALVTGVLFGSLPAWCAAQTDILSVMKHGAPLRSVKPTAWRNAFVAVQIAASFVLLVCAGLFIRTLHRTQHVDLGFATDRLLVMSFDLGLQGYSPARGQKFLDDVKRQAGAIAGVQASSVSDSLPLNPWSEDMKIWFDGSGDQTGGDGVMVNFALVDADYFSTLGLPLLQGQSFDDSDAAGRKPVVIVNETLARMMAPDGDALNRHVRFNSDGGGHRVVGVARDSKHVMLGEPPRPFIYLSLAQNYRPTASLIVRTATPAGALVSDVARVVQCINPDLPIQHAVTMDEHVATQHFVPRWAAVLLSLFAGLALVLTLLGIWGVTAYDASQRTREIGVRIAFGARRADIMRLVLGQGLKVLTIGIGAGLACSFVAARFVGEFLYEVSPLDALSYIFAVLELSVAAVLAYALPARRATAITPTDALRHE